MKRTRKKVIKREIKKTIRLRSRRLPKRSSNKIKRSSNKIKRSSNKIKQSSNKIKRSSNKTKRSSNKIKRNKHNKYRKTRKIYIGGVYDFDNPDDIKKIYTNYLKNISEQLDDLKLDKEKEYIELKPIKKNIIIETIIKLLYGLRTELKDNKDNNYYKLCDNPDKKDKLKGPLRVILNKIGEKLIENRNKVTLIERNNRNKKTENQKLNLPQPDYLAEIELWKQFKTAFEEGYKFFLDIGREKETAAPTNAPTKASFVRPPPSATRPQVNLNFIPEHFQNLIDSVEDKHTKESIKKLVEDISNAFDAIIESYEKKQIRPDKEILFKLSNSFKNLVSIISDKTYKDWLSELYRNNIDQTFLKNTGKNNYPEEKQLFIDFQKAFNNGPPKEETHADLDALINEAAANTAGEDAAGEDVEFTPPSVVGEGNVDEFGYTHATPDDEDINIETPATMNVYTIFTDFDLTITRDHSMFVEPIAGKKHKETPNEQIAINNNQQAILDAFKGFGETVNVVIVTGSDYEDIIKNRAEILGKELNEYLENIEIIGFPRQKITNPTMPQADINAALENKGMFNTDDPRWQEIMDEYSRDNQVMDTKKADKLMRAKVKHAQIQNYFNRHPEADPERSLFIDDTIENWVYMKENPFLQTNKPITSILAIQKQYERNFELIEIFLKKKREIFNKDDKLTPIEQKFYENHIKEEEKLLTQYNEVEKYRINPGASNRGASNRGASNRDPRRTVVALVKPQ
jgi:hypothetical protein